VERPPNPKEATIHTTPFDFDVISGPSVPRDDREPEPQPAGDAQPAAGAPPAQPQTR